MRDELFGIDLFNFLNAIICFQKLHIKANILSIPERNHIANVAIADKYTSPTIPGETISPTKYMTNNFHKRHIE